MTKYEIIIYWSAADKIFVAEMPELKGCIAHGDTQVQINGQVFWAAGQQQG